MLFIKNQQEEDTILNYFIKNNVEHTTGDE